MFSYVRDITHFCVTLYHKFFGKKENDVQKHIFSFPSSPSLIITKTDQIQPQLKNYHCNHCQNDSRLGCLLPKNNLK